MLTWNTSGITLQRTTQGKELLTTKVAWTDVIGVVAYKANLVFLDLICLAIFAETGNVEINEQMDGWERLIEELQVHLPGFPRASSWFDRVAQPRFSTNFTRLYPKAENQELN